MLESRVTLAKAVQIKPIPFFYWGTLGPGLRGLPKLAYLSARSISAAAAAISLLLCNLCEIIVQASYPVPCAFRRRASLTFAAAEPCTPMRGVARGRSPPTTPLGSAFPDGPGAPPELPNAGALARAAPVCSALTSPATGAKLAQSNSDAPCSAHRVEQTPPPARRPSRHGS